MVKKRLSKWLRKPNPEKYHLLSSTDKGNTLRGGSSKKEIVNAKNSTE